MKHVKRPKLENTGVKLPFKMDSVLSGASKKVLEMARKKDKFIEDKDGGGKMFSAAKLVAKGWVPVSSLSEFKPN